MSDIHQSVVKKVLSDLGNGINPVTGEDLPSKSKANNITASRLLLNLANEFSPKRFPKKEKRTDEQVSHDNEKLGRPVNSHKPWTDDDVSEVIKLFNSGINISEIAGFIGRTPLAVAGKLSRLERISKEQLAEFEPKKVDKPVM